MRNVRWDFNQFACAQDQFFVADFEVQRTADAVTELFTVMAVAWNDAAFSDGQKRHRDFLACEKTARKQTVDVLFGNFIQLVMFHCSPIKAGKL